MSKNKDIILTLSVFYFAVYNSLFSKVFANHIIFDIRYIIALMMVGYVLLKLVTKKNEVRHLMVIILLVIFALIEESILKDTSISMFFLFAIYASFFSVSIVINSYMIGLTFAVIFVVGLSICGILPIEYQLITFGFNNPNILGLYIFEVCASYLALHWYSNNRLFLIFYVLCLAVEVVILNDSTAMICMILYLMIYLFRKKHINKYIVIMFPTFAISVSLVLTVLYGKYNWTYGVNSLLSHRLEIWNYYYNLYGITFLPRNVSWTTANAFQQELYGKNIPIIISGAFDGAYMFNLITQGIVVTMVIIVILTIALYKLYKENLKQLISLYIVFLIFSISETSPLAFITYFESYLLIISIIVFFKNSIANDVYLLSKN